MAGAAGPAILGDQSLVGKKVSATRFKKIDYRGWATAEVSGGNRQRLAELSEEMDGVLDL